MMKQKFIWLFLVVSVAFCMLLPGCDGSEGEQTVQTQPSVSQVTQPQYENVKIYWNIDKEYYSTNQANRIAKDSYYVLDMAVEGKTVQVKMADEQMVKFADTLEVMGLVFDEKGIVEKVLRIEEFAGQIVAEDYVITSVTDQQIVCNASVSGTGFSMTLPISAETKIYNMGDPSETVQLRPQSRILAIRNDSGVITHVFAETWNQKTAHCSHCDKEVEWLSWNGVSALLDGNHYYIEKEKVDVKNVAYIGSATDSTPEVTLDLCGNTISGIGTRVFRIYGTLNLLDSGENGTITSTHTGQAPIFYVYDRAVFNMYGGNLRSSGKLNTQAGLGAMGLSADSEVGGTFNMYGGTLSGGNTKKNGGILDMYHGSVFNLYGGTVYGGKAEGNGGTVAMSEKSVVNIYGGIIEMGVAGGKGNCIYGAGTVNLYGVAKIAQVYVSPGKLIQATEMKEESSVGILMANGYGAFAVTDNSIHANCFIPASGGIVEYLEGKLYLKEVPTV